MGNNVLLSTKHLNAKGNRELVPQFVGPFPIVQWVGPLAYWLNVGIFYRQVHLIFHVSLIKPFCAVCVGYWHPSEGVYVGT